MLVRILAVFCIVILSACGAGNSSSSNRVSSGQSALQNGRLIDSPVSGVQYITASVNGLKTGRNGEFNYRSGEIVTFSVGNLILGRSVAASRLTLLDIVPGARTDYSAGMGLTEVFEKYPAILNIARLLQSLDVDRNTASGIEIPVEAKMIVEDYLGSIDFTSPDLFADSESGGVEFVCDVIKTRGASICSTNNIQSASAAADEVSATETAVDVNDLPEASAGNAQQVLESTTINLVGMAEDSDGTIVDIEWFESDRNGVAKANPITISNPNQLNTSFTAPEVTADTIFYFTLQVTDNDGGIGTDTVRILVKNDDGSTDLAPEANAGDDQVVDVGDVVELDGSASSDAEGDISQYTWQQIDADGEIVTDGPELSGGSEAVAKFTAPNVNENTVLLFQLTVVDSANQQDTDIVNITIQVATSNAAPVSDAGADQVVDEAQVVVLDGTASDDADGDDLSYVWKQEAGPSVELRDSAASQANFTAPSTEESIDLSFSLTVSDGTLSSKDTVKITVNPKAAEPTSCDTTDPTSYGVCFDVCTDQDESTFCPLPIDGDPAVPPQLQSVLDQLDACSDRDPTTVCPLPIEDQPGGGDPVSCDGADPTTYGACFQACVDSAPSCPLSQDLASDPVSILELLGDCSDETFGTVCSIVESPPGGDLGSCDGADPTTYGACFQACVDSAPSCPLSQDLASDPVSILELLGACADEMSSTVCSIVEGGTGTLPGE
jgi:hypothetical protein